MCIRLGDATELWDFGCSLKGLFWDISDWDVEVDRPYMLPGPTIAFALGLFDVAAWCSSLVNNGPRDVFIFC